MGFSEPLKASVRRKAHFRCCLCHALGVEIHHIIPDAEGGPDIEENAAPLCPSCHETYGANPLKRKFITEARDFWYEICEKRYASDPQKLDDILNGVQQTAIGVEQIIAYLSNENDVPHDKTKFSSLSEFFDRLEEEILRSSEGSPMNAFLRLYQAIERELSLYGASVGFARSDIWDLRVATIKLAGRHLVLDKLLEILGLYSQLYHKTVVDDEGEEVSDQDILQSISVGLRLPRIIRDTLLTYEKQAKLPNC